MPIIDLDHHAQAGPGRPSRRHLPALIAPAVGSLLFGLTGEPEGPAGTADETNACSSVSARGGSHGSVVVLDSKTGEIVRMIHCPV
ncbi:hypothetical protein FHR83_008053 [Actinoplanes campanulatus]|uniref:Uncharacterized protein n=1 Tax=Actinoplanes campanulatus TaxID=113559 RepID=A0A7W5FJ44_9ACTN|nr:hypothetical protein [Actinoplanes campanulatus]MBB3100331.1 hypothetical protein [Actinoplanes campanulatus]